MDDTVDIAIFYVGYVEAFARFQGGGEPIHVLFDRAMRSQSPDWFVRGPTIVEAGPTAIVGSFVPLFEALNWATSLEQYIRAKWPLELSGSERWHDSIPHGQTVKAVQFARNCVHHDWAYALTLGDGDGDLPTRVASWLWIWRARLPNGKKDAIGEKVYQDDLAGEPVIGALGRLLAVFGKGMRELHNHGRVQSDLLAELLPTIDTFDPAGFSRNAVTGD